MNLVQPRLGHPVRFPRRASDSASNRASEPLHRPLPLAVSRRWCAGRGSRTPCSIRAVRHLDCEAMAPDLRRSARAGGRAVGSTASRHARPCRSRTSSRASLEQSPTWDVSRARGISWRRHAMNARANRSWALCIVGVAHDRGDADTVAHSGRRRSRPRSRRSNVAQRRTDGVLGLSLARPYQGRTGWRQATAWTSAFRRRASSP